MLVVQAPRAAGATLASCGHLTGAAITLLDYIALPYITLHCIALHCIALQNCGVEMPDGSNRC
jgi:quinol-cytochrome oxidoreductase complex cytochrome b subunit